MRLQGYLFEKNNPELVKSLEDEFETSPKYLVLSLIDSADKKKIMNIINTYNSGSRKYSFGVWGSIKDQLQVKLIVRGSFLGRIRTPELLSHDNWMPLAYNAKVRIQKYQFVADKGPSKGQKILGVHFFLETLEVVS